MRLNVMLLTPREVVFEGEANSVILPGEQGVFELLPFHKNLLSRLIFGNLLIDEKVFPITRGIVKVQQDNVTIIVEER